jgi:hypothetical protein
MTTEIARTYEKAGKLLPNNTALQYRRQPYFPCILLTNGSFMRWNAAVPIPGKTKTFLFTITFRINFTAYKAAAQ